MTKHQRELADYLRREYGATETRLEYGGRHPKLRFRCRGREHAYPVSSSLGDPRAARNIEATLKKMLGEPIRPETTFPRSLETMMEELNKALPNGYNQKNVPPEPVLMLSGPQEREPGRRWKIKMSGYKRGEGYSGIVMWFLFPPEVRKEFAPNITVTQLDNTHWKITKGGLSRFSPYSNGNYARVTMTDRDGMPFGSTPAEAIESDGALLIHMPQDQRRSIDIIRSISSSQGHSQFSERDRSEPPIVNAPPLPESVEADLPEAPSSMVPQLLMREILREVARVEELGPYRLTRLKDGRFVWRAPTIE